MHVSRFPGGIVLIQVILPCIFVLGPARQEKLSVHDHITDCESSFRSDYVILEIIAL